MSDIDILRDIYLVNLVGFGKTFFENSYWNIFKYFLMLIEVFSHTYSIYFLNKIFASECIYNKNKIKVFWRNLWNVLMSAGVILSKKLPFGKISSPENFFTRFGRKTRQKQSWRFGATLLGILYIYMYKRERKKI